MDSRKLHRSWLIALCGLGLVTTSSACMPGQSSTKIKDEQLGRLSAADREQLVDEQRNVNVAKANVDASKVALDEAKEFRKTSKQQANAAKDMHEQTAKELKTATKAGGQGSDLGALQKREQMRAEQARAMSAKAEYGDRLVDLRAAEVDNREAEHELTEAQFNSAQYELLKERGLAGKLDGNKFMERQRKAEAEYQKTDQQVREKLAAAKASRQNWSAQKQTAEGAGEGQAAQPVGEDEPELIEAPRPPDSLKPSPSSAQTKSAGEE